MTIPPPSVAAVIRTAPDGDDQEAAAHRASLIGKMVDTLVRTRPQTAAHALWILRRAFSNYPLALRLAALAATMNDITF